MKRLLAILALTLILAAASIAVAAPPLNDLLVILRDAPVAGEIRAACYCGILQGNGYTAEVYRDYWVRYLDDEGNWQIVEVGAF